VNRFRTIAMAAIAGFVLVACGPAASGSTAPSKAAQASQAAQASGGGVGPSFTEGAVADLEALLPDKVGDLTMTKSSSKGSDYLTASGSSPEMIQFLHAVGVSPSDVSLAIGSAYNTDLSSGVFMFVIRAKGADSGKLVAAFKTASATGTQSPIQWVSANLAGKSVQSAQSNGATNYLYTKGDVLFWFIATSPALGEQLIGLLP
jgi:hypothetical protein